MLDAAEDAGVARAAFILVAGLLNLLVSRGVVGGEEAATFLDNALLTYELRHACDPAGRGAFEVIRRSFPTLLPGSENV